jgi:predicted aconitase
MKLKDDEKRMLHGEQGKAIQKAMEFLAAIGEANDAEEMVSVSSVHLLTLVDKSVPYELTRELTKGVKVKVPTTTHARAFDVNRVKDMGMSDSAIEENRQIIAEIDRLYHDLGTIPTYTCFPYSWHNLRVGDHVSFTDTLVVQMVNAWFGARTNMETPVSTVAAAITGKTPRYGMHLTENRLGRILIEVSSALDVDNFDYADYGALSFWAGKLSVNGLPAIPVYQGLSPRATIISAKNMTLSHTWNSGMGMFHLVGITPEAPTVEAAFGGRKPAAKFTFGKKEMDEAYHGLTTATEENVDVVCLTCPNCTLQEIVNIARLLQGKKVHKDTQLWVGTNHTTKDVAKRMGLIDMIEGAGGIVITDACATYHPIAALKPRVVASNAAHLQNTLVLTEGQTTVWFGRTTDCINAAVKGKWEV